MTKITNIDRRALIEIEARVRDAIKDLGDELGIDFEYKGGTYGNETGVIRLGLSVRDNGTGLSAEEARFAKYCSYYSMTPSDYNRTFYSEGIQYRIAGLKPTSPKYPIEVVRVRDSKPFKMTESAVRSGLDREDAKLKKTA